MKTEDKKWMNLLTQIEMLFQENFNLNIAGKDSVTQRQHRRVEERKEIYDSDESDEKEIPIQEESKL